jgi:hypothetical protein
MTPAWAQRQEALLRDCVVSPDVFTPLVDCLRDFVRPYQYALETEAGKRNVYLYLAGLLSHLPRKNSSPEKFEAKRCCSAPRCYVPHCIVSAFFLEPPPMRTRKLPLPDNALPPLERFLQQPKPARVCRRAPAVRDVVTGQRLPTVSATRPLTSSALRTWV